MPEPFPLYRVAEFHTDRRVTWHATDAAELDRRARERDTTRIARVVHTLPLPIVRDVAHAASWRSCPCPLCGRRRRRWTAHVVGVGMGILWIVVGLWAAILGGLVVAVDGATDFTPAPGFVAAFYGGIVAIAAGLALAIYCHRWLR